MGGTDMKKLLFFVEGKDDINFLKDYLNHVGIYSNDFHDFISTDGWTNLPMVANKFKENTLSNGANVILFDADQDFQLRTNEINEQIRQIRVDAKLFLFPNNNDTGSLDDLLIKIVNKVKTEILVCFDSYCSCLKGNPEYQVPTLKEKIYAYLQAIGAECRIGKRNYQNLDIWNLDHEALAPLCEFFTTNHLI